ncbi:MAG TPA: ATP-binding protein [Thermoanaerobaculia bacterium]|nr:ATP-binding protein [Thermoanaerobaculia bacterium]
MSEARDIGEAARPRRADATPWLLLAAALLQLVPVAGALAMPLVGAGWWRWRRELRGVFAWIFALGLAAVWIGDLWTWARWRQVRSQAALLETVESAYRVAVEGLRTRAAAATLSLDAPSAEPASRAAAFDRLETLAGREPSGATLVLVDGSGRAAAWAGPGLRHDLPEADLALEGVSSLAGFTAVTLYAVAPLEPGARRPWRIVAGRSSSTATLPFAPSWLPQPAPAAPAAWSLAAPEPVGPPANAGAPEEAAGGLWIDVVVEGAPTLRLSSTWLSRLEGLRLPAPGWVLAVLAAMALASGFDLATRRAPVRGGRRLVSAALLGGTLVAVALAFGVDGGVVGAAVAGGAALGWSLARSDPAAARWRALMPLAVAAALCLLLQRLLGARDLSAALGSDLEGWLLRFGIWGLVFAGALRSSRSAAGEGDRRWTWLAAFLASGLAGAALADRPTLAAPLLALAAVALVQWAGGGLRGIPARVGALALAAAWLSGSLWTVASRDALRAELVARVIVAPGEATVAGEKLHRFFEGVDLESLALGPPERLAERRDLALALWQASPLAERTGLSALRVVLDDGSESRFTDGLDFVDPEAAGPALSAGDADLAARAAAAAAGVAELFAGFVPVGVVEYLSLPLTRRAGPQRLVGGELAQALLAGASASATAAPLPGGARVTLAPARQPLEPRAGWQRRNGRWVLGPYPAGTGPAPLAAEVRVPELVATEALRAVAVHATAVTVALLALGVLAVALALLRRPSRRALVWWASSYSKKLVLVAAVLLVVPIALLDLFLFQSFERRLLREQLANGEAALRSAETILADYLPTLEPGFSFTSAVDAELLAWLSRVVSHEVNLYWRGYAYASSRPELFAAGILPRRIPGAVFSRLALAEEPIAVQQHRIGPGLRYLELYRPVALPGEEPGENGLFLSVPLVAQQEEARRALAVLGQQTVIVTALILLALVVVGSRLAASFTTPLMEIVRGTDRIARGDRRLGVEPREPELAALALAIDDMAGRIAEGRERLLREKQVVEGVVAHITSAVVSIGGDQRVQMCNGTARELLDVRSGEPLGELAARWADTPLGELLAAPPDELVRRTARILRDGEEQEWTVVWAPVAGAGDPAALLVVEDVTEVLRGQRLEAWAEMARMIAHEVKNPLTPIRLSAEHLQRVRQESPERLDEVFDRCIGNILAQVSVLRDIAAEFSVYSRIPGAELRARDLVPTVAEVVEAYAAAPPRGITVSLHAPRPALVRFDPRLVGRAVRNLVENAVQASGDRGRVEIAVEPGGREVVVRVADRGPGVPPELLPRIFEPNFSTTSGGTGLGLPITQRIVEEHGGRIEAINREGGGLSVTITLPRAEIDAGVGAATGGSA